MTDGVEIPPGDRAQLVWPDEEDAQIVVTLQGQHKRFTYRIDRVRPGKNTVKRNVAVLNGPDNTKDYMFLGAIYPASGYFHNRRSPIARTALCNQAFEWFWRNPESDRVVVLISRPCARCRRMLTTPESIRRGLGPDCAKRQAS